MITRTDFDAELREVVDDHSTHDLLEVPAIRDAFAAHYKDKVLRRLAARGLVEEEVEVVVVEELNNLQ